MTIAEEVDRLTETEKRVIFECADLNPDMDFGTLCVHLTLRLGKTVSKDAIYSAYVEGLFT